MNGSAWMRASVQVLTLTNKPRAIKRMERGLLLQVTIVLLKRLHKNEAIRLVGRKFTDVLGGPRYMSEQWFRRFNMFWIFHRLLTRKKIVSRRCALAAQWRELQSNPQSNYILVCSFMIDICFLSRRHAPTPALLNGSPPIQGSPTLSRLTVPYSGTAQILPLLLSLFLDSHPEQTSTGLPVQSFILHCPTFYNHACSFEFNLRLHRCASLCKVSSLPQSCRSDLRLTLHVRPTCNRISPALICPVSIHIQLKPRYLSTLLPDICYLLLTISLQLSFIRVAPSHIRSVSYRKHMLSLHPLLPPRYS